MATGGDAGLDAAAAGHAELTGHAPLRLPVEKQQLDVFVAAPGEGHSARGLRGVRARVPVGGARPTRGCHVIRYMIPLLCCAASATRPAELRRHETYERQSVVSLYTRIGSNRGNPQSTIMQVWYM